MFLDLINLYTKNNNSNRTPLEDFNTECFANILNLYSDIKTDFISNFLNLPKDAYLIKTQLKKDLPNSPNCIVDLVFIGTNNICFIENKVESQEGWEQLKRYGEVLDIHYKKSNKYLFYCTKYSDIKNENGEYSKYNFKQIKWFEIANFLIKYQKSNPLINDYIKFLTNYKMAQDNTIKSENLLSMENLLKTIEVAEFHIENCKPEFNKEFGSEKYDRNFNWNQIKTHNRVCHYNSGVLKSNNKEHSEILYCIEFNNLKLRTQIYVNANNIQYQQFKKLNFDKNIFKTYDFGNGFCYYLDTDIGKYLNDINSDKNIKQWFLNSFDIMKNIITIKSNLDW